MWMSISKVQLFSIPVSDQDVAKRFYVDVLGFTLVNDVQMNPDIRWVMVSPPGAATAITLVTWFDSMPAGSLRGLVLETNDLAGDIVALREKGVDIPGEVETAPWGDFVQFSDPDGNGIVLQASS
jgi:catechol 2,3-dioxygenase-like lactoylglutathione lyase family enzyme